jgi:hypothetical protein
MKGTFLSNYNDNFVDLLNVDLPKFVPSVLWDKLDKYRWDIPGMKRFLARNYRAKLQHTTCLIWFTVSGEFDHLENRISLFVESAPELTDRQWRAFKFELIITLMHEYVHYMQWSFHQDEFEKILLHKESTNEDVQEQRDYYAAWDEIQAYAHCIYMEMKDRNSHKPVAEMLQHPTCYYSPTLRHIKSLYEGFDQPIKYLYREVLKWEKRYDCMRNHIAT